IVPYNGRRNNTWADKVVRWTTTTNETSDSIMQVAVNNLRTQGQSQSGTTYVRVFNTLIAERHEAVSVAVPEGWKAADVIVRDENKKKIPTQAITGQDGEAVMFAAQVPPLGYSTYTLERGKSSKTKGATVDLKKDGTYVIETDLYTIVVDPARGGRIKSLVAKRMGNKEFVDQGNERSFNEIRGFFYEKDRFYSNVEHPVRVNILDKGPLAVRIEMQGMMDVHPYTQVLTVRQGDRKIDFDLTLDWQGNPGIGKYSQAEHYEAVDRDKAFYNDKYKLLAC